MIGSIVLVVNFLTNAKKTIPIHHRTILYIYRMIFHFHWMRIFSMRNIIYAHNSVLCCIHCMSYGFRLQLFLPFPWNLLRSLFMSNFFSFFFFSHSIFHIFRFCKHISNTYAINIYLWFWPTQQNESKFMIHILDANK